MYIVHLLAASHIVRYMQGKVDRFVASHIATNACVLSTLYVLIICWPCKGKSCCIPNYLHCLGLTIHEKIFTHVHVTSMYPWEHDVITI